MLGMEDASLLTDNGAVYRGVALLGMDLSSKRATASYVFRRREGLTIGDRRFETSER